jgi:protein gp37
MATDSKIQWTDHTENDWSGCAKVSEGCKYCYMYRDKDRYGADPTKVIKTSQATINSVLKKAKAGDKIFTCSWSDFFIEDADPWRDEAWDRIIKNDHLIWQILTKRPHRIADCLPKNGIPRNVWLGVSIESAKYIERLKYIEDLNCTRFASLEPLIGPIDLNVQIPGGKGTAISALDWVIIGGESGNDTGKYRYRPSELEWYTDVVSQCRAANVPIFVKQLGTHLAKHMFLEDRHGGNMDEFPRALQVREFPETVLIPTSRNDGSNEQQFSNLKIQSTTQEAVSGEVNNSRTTPASKSKTMNNTITRKTVPVSDIHPHALYKRIVSAIKTPKFYLDGLKDYGIGELPLITSASELLSHWHVVDAAVSSGVEYIEVNQIDIDTAKIPQCILWGDLLKAKQYTAVTIAIDYLLNEYITTPEGKRWWTSIEGDKEEKLAYIFATSSSTIKRLLSAGRNYPELLRLVQNGNMDWKTMQDRINADNKEKTQKASNIPKPSEEAKIQPAASPAEPTEATDDSQDENIGEGEQTDGDQFESGDSTSAPSEVNVTQTADNYEFSSATFTLKDGRTLNVTVGDSGHELSVNGEPLPLVYTYQYDLGQQGNTEYYTTMFTGLDMMGDCSFQIVIDNPKKLFKK